MKWMKGVRFLSLACACLVMTSCMEQVGTLIKGNSLIVEGQYLSKGPLASEKEDKTPFYLLSFRRSNPNEKFPLLVVFHGTGEDGKMFIDLWQELAEENRIMVLAPTRNRISGRSQNVAEASQALIDQIMFEYPVDPYNVTLVGVSSGALIARQIAVKHPALYRNIVLMATPGFENYIDAIRDKKFPAVLYVHGKNDDQFPISALMHEADALKKKGIKVGFIEDPEGRHEVRADWLPHVISWMKTHKLK